MWAGLVAAEFVMEAVCRDDAMAKHAAVIHFWLDVLLEVPLIFGVVVTGAVLTARVWPLTSLLLVKVSFASVAIVCNLYCVGVVVRRRRLREDRVAVRRLRRLVFVSGAGVPFGLGALYVGLAYFHGL
jgi:hypothetical protein